MKKIFTSSLVVSLFLTIANASASSACDKPNLTDFDRNYCLNKVYGEADKELNIKYKQLKSMLNGEGKRKLARGEKGWIRDRDNSCQFGSTTYINCEIDYTVDRTNFLQDRIRECKSAGCMNSKL
jgi:uncharacterized protein YecT (DUF1311 family)